jgi:hypothetical protein
VYLTLPFMLEQEDEETAVYVEQVEGGKPAVVGTISVQKSALSTPPPSVIRVTLHFREGGPALSDSAGLTVSGRAVSSEKALKAGDEVTIVKSRRGKVASPPEWLEQFIGKTGTVLWTTASGAMVDLSGSATWFAYAELERGNPEVP